MVFGHIPFDEITKPQGQKPPSKKEARELEARLASPLDRAAAFVADLVLLIPLLTLAVSPFRRYALEAQLLENSERFAFAYVLGIGVALLCFLAYQTVFLAWWGATPGKRALGLRVEPLWEPRRKPQAMTALARSIAILLEAMCLGVPWIAVYGNSRRRPFHDRVGDTVVVAVRSTKAAGPPSLAEVSMASGVLAAALFVFGFMVSVQLVRLHSSGEAETLIADLEESGGLCSAVGDADRKWIPPSGTEKPSRIAVALTLFQAEVVDEVCLREEAEFSLWSGKDKATGYLARGLAEIDDLTVAESYFVKVCETEAGSDACRAARILESPDESPDQAEARLAEVEREQEFDKIASSLDENSAPYLKILFAKQFSAQKRDERVLDLIEALPPHKSLAYFTASERAKALWNLGRLPEARLSLRASAEVADALQRVDISRWFCDSETMTSGCSADAKKACDLMGAVVDDSDVYLAQNEVVVSYLRGEACSDRLNATRFADIEKKVADEDAKTYIRALAKLAGDEQDEATKLLLSLATGAGRSGPFFIESNARLAELASTAIDLEQVRTAWAASDPGQVGWTFLGRRLMERYNSMHAWSDSVQVGMKMAENDGIDRLAARSMIVATYRSGQVAKTLSFLEKLGELPKLDSVSKERSPASSDGFEEVLAEITGKELKP